MSKFLSLEPCDFPGIDFFFYKSFFSKTLFNLGKMKLLGFFFFFHDSSCFNQSASSFGAWQGYYIPNDRTNLEKSVSKLSKACLLWAEGLGCGLRWV